MQSILLLDIILTSCAYTVSLQCKPKPSTWQALTLVFWNRKNWHFGFWEVKYGEIDICFSSKMSFPIQIPEARLFYCSPNSPVMAPVLYSRDIAIIMSNAKCALIDWAQNNNHDGIKFPQARYLALYTTCLLNDVLQIQIWDIDSGNQESPYPRFPFSYKAVEDHVQIKLCPL